MIELLHLCAGYKATQVLFDITAEIRPGHLVGIIGPNGCGKSTLLKTVAHLLSPTAGEIRIDGQSTASMPEGFRAKHIAYLSQGHRIPDMTVGQLVLHGRYPHLHFPKRYSASDRKIASAAMETLGISALSDHPLSSLSGGMRQSAYLAMALAQETDYILLDEPTTYLDIANQITLMRLLRRLTDAGKGIAAVMHDLPMALTYCDEIWVMHDGRIAEMGTPRKICTSEILEELFGVRITHENGDYYYQFKNETVS